MTVARAQHPRLQWHECTPSMPFDRVHGGGRARGRARIPKPYSAAIHNRTYNVHIASARERLAGDVGHYIHVTSVLYIPPVMCNRRCAIVALGHLRPGHRPVRLPTQNRAGFPAPKRHRGKQNRPMQQPRRAYGLWCVRCRRRAIREGSGRSQAVAAPSASKRRRKRGRS